MELGLTVLTGREGKKAQHRQMLIDATIDMIAEYGIVGASVTRIVNRAGLSRGMVHLHFENKRHLQVEAARYMGEQYFAKMDVFLQSAGDSPQARLEAMISANLCEEILNRRTINTWYAFRGEARSQNAFAEYSDSRDDTLDNMFIDAFRSLADDRSKPDALARDAAHGTIALLEGMWTDYLLHSDAFNRDSAERIVFRFVCALFPDYFDLKGAARNRAG